MWIKITLIKAYFWVSTEHVEDPDLRDKRTLDWVRIEKELEIFLTA